MHIEVHFFLTGYYDAYKMSRQASDAVILETLDSLLKDLSYIYTLLEADKHEDPISDSTDYILKRIKVPEP